MIKFLLPKSFTQWFFQQILYHAMLNCIGVRERGMLSMQELPNRP